MQTIYVQFSDETESTVVGYFGGPQDEDTHPHQGTIETSDQRWKDYVSAQPATIQKLLPAAT